MAAGTTLLMEALKGIIDTEFAPEGIVCQYDNIHPSLGDMGPLAGVAPELEEPGRDDANTLSFAVEVRFFLKYTREIDPKQSVDPRIIVGMAERFRRACKDWENANTGTNDLWYLMVGRTTYPDDPTGNKSRFHSRVLGRGTNPAELA